MKKLLVIITSLALMCCVFGLSALADNTVEVYVTVSDGQPEIANQKVEVSDFDKDGTLTVNDALYAAHQACFPGGAEAGYSYENSDWGLSLTKLWGIENWGSYGYYVNNVSAWSLADPVKSGDFINAFVYSDTVTYSDKYCYFDCNFSRISDSSHDAYTLYGVYFDQNYTPFSAPIKNAVILVDGEKTHITTDENGRFYADSLTGLKSGTHTVSAKSDSEILVPPAMTVIVGDGTDSSADTVSDVPEESSVSEISEVSVTDTPATVGENPENPKSGDSSVAVASAVALILCCGTLLVIGKK